MNEQSQECSRDIYFKEISVYMSRLSLQNIETSSLLGNVK